MDIECFMTFLITVMACELRSNAFKTYVLQKTCVIDKEIKSFDSTHSTKMTVDSVEKRVNKWKFIRKNERCVWKLHRGFCRMDDLYKKKLDR